MRGYQCGRFSSVLDPEAQEKFKAITGICFKSRDCLKDWADMKSKGIKIKIKCQAINIATSIAAAALVMYNMA